jgi:hypothetical protein
LKTGTAAIGTAEDAKYAEEKSPVLSSHSLSRISRIARLEIVF